MRKNNKVEFVKVEVSVPKPIVDFVSALSQFAGFNIEEFWRNALTAEIQGILDTNLESCLDFDKITERYRLKEILNDC